MILAAITTCRRAPAMVERAVKSVIAQTYTDWNLVVVDDSPNDYEFREDVRKMVEGYAAQDSRISYVAHDKNYGAQRARNTALKIAENAYWGGGHEFIAYLDDDDEWLPEKLEKQITRFNECGENTGLVYCYFYYADKNFAEHRHIPHLQHIGAEGNVYPRLLENNFVAMLALIRTKCLVDIGGFDEAMPALQDWDTWLRLSVRYDFACVKEPLVVVYQDRGSEHVLGSYTRIIRGYELIESKNKEYLTANPRTYCKLIENNLPLYLLNGEYRKFVSLWLKLLRLQPRNKISSIFVMLRSFSTLMKESVKSLLFKINPQLFYGLKKVKYRLKGEHTN